MTGFVFQNYSSCRLKEGNSTFREDILVALTGSMINFRSKIVTISEEWSLIRSLGSDSGKQNRSITRVGLPATTAIDVSGIHVVGNFGKVSAGQAGPREECN